MADLKASRHNGWYVFGGRRVPSVTTILDKTGNKEALENWKSRTPDWEQISKRSAVIGTLAHYRVLKRYSATKLEPPDVPTTDWPDDIRMLLSNIDKAFEKSRLVIDTNRPRFVEHTVLHLSPPAYAGTLDLAGYVNGRMAIVDLKTSKKIWDDYTLQVAAYAHALKKQRVNVDCGAIVRVDPISADSEVLWIDKDQLAEALTKFLSRAEAFWSATKRH